MNIRNAADDGGKSAIIVSASSDIGAAMSRRWSEAGWRVFGTFRTTSAAVRELEDNGVLLFRADLSDAVSVSQACRELRERCPQWDVLVLCPGTTEPIGSFDSCDFEEWEKSIRVNLTAQLRFVHELLPTRRLASPIAPCVLFFAGGGTNNAPTRYSAYTVSKIALIKMCELLDAELPDTKFVIVGPGWVKTKIHSETLQAGERAGSNFERTKVKLAGNGWTPMPAVLDCCDWLIRMPKESVGGRNFSVIHDKWGSEELLRSLSENPNLYKLRRHGNDR